MLNLKRKAAPTLLVLIGLLSSPAGAQDAQLNLDGAWRGTIRCEKNALITARMDVRVVDGQFEALLQPLSVQGELSGSSPVLGLLQFKGVQNGNAINFTATSRGRPFSNLKANVKDGGRTIAATLPPETGCSGLYFTRSAQAAAQPTPTSPVPAGTDASKLTGVWVGRYICAQGSTGLLMAVKGEANGSLQTRFSFYPLPENPFVPAGSLDVQSRLLGEQLVNMQSAWVSQPQGFTFGVGGKLTLSEDAQTLTVVPEGVSGCLKLEVQRQP
jgi:hypothetical protein